MSVTRCQNHVISSIAV